MAFRTGDGLEVNGILVVDAGGNIQSVPSVAINEASSAMDTTQLKLEVNGNASIRGANALFFGITTNNYNSWKTKIWNNNTSTMYINAQEFNVNNAGYGSLTFLKANASGVDGTTFRDLDNTAYYTNPAGNSVLSTVDIQRLDVNNSGFITFYGNGSQDHSIGSYLDDDIRINSYGAMYISLDSNGNNDSAADFKIVKHAGGSSAWAATDELFKVDGETSAVTIGNSQVDATINALASMVLNIDSDNNSSGENFFVKHNANTSGGGSTLFSVSAAGNAEATTSLRAPIFYDSDNTAYYTSPNTTSIMNSVYMGTALVVGATAAQSGMGQIAVASSGNPYISFHGGGDTARDAYFQYLNDNDRFYHGEVAYTETVGSYRAPLFYDSNNTNYYVNPADTTQSAKFRQHVSIGDGGNTTNSGTWGARLNLTDSVHSKIEVGQDANSVNSHWYAHTGQDSIKFGTSTAHDVEFQRGGTTRLELTSDSIKFSGSINMNGHNIRRGNHHTGHLEGSYNNIGGNGAKSNPIYTIGSSYNPASTTLGNMYGIGFADTGSSPTFLPSSFSGGWGMYVASAGTARVYLGGGTGDGNFLGNLKADAFYDIDDTNYYVKPSISASKIVGLNIHGGANQNTNDATLYVEKTNNNDWAIRINGTGSATEYGLKVDLSGAHSYAAQFKNNTAEYSRIGTDFMQHNAGVRSPKVIGGTSSVALTSNGPLAVYDTGNPFISFHTGAARTAYIQELSGRFYFGEVPYTESVGSFRAPVFYDSDNAGYYLDPSSTGTSLSVAGNIIVPGYAQIAGVELSGGDTRSLSGMANNQWVTVANLTGSRKADIIEVYDNESSRHNYLKMEVSWSYGQGSIQIINGVRHGNHTIQYVRLLYNTADRTYGTGKLQVYLGNWNTAYSLKIKQLGFGRTGWGRATIPSTVEAGLPSGNTIMEDTTMQCIESSKGSFGSTGRIGTVGGIDLFDGSPIKFHTTSGDGTSTERGFIDAQEGGHLRLATSGGENIVFQDGGVGGTTNLTILGSGEMVKEATERFTIKSHSNGWEGGMRMYAQNGSTIFQIHPDNNGHMYVDQTWRFSNNTLASGHGRLSHHTGHLVGGYNNVGSSGGKSSPIYTIGSSYNPTDSSISGMYGIGYTTYSASLMNTALAGATDWGMYVAANGTGRVWLDGYNGNISSAGSVYASAFYDSNNANYYLNPASTSFLDSISVKVGSENTGGANSSTVGLIMRHGGSSYNNNTWAHKFHKYDHGGGVPLYLSETIGTGAWSGIQRWGSYSGDNYKNVFFSALKVVGSVDADAFYDRNNTAYFLNPSANAGNSLKTIGDWRQASGTWSGEVAGKMQYHSNNWYIQSSAETIFRNASGVNTMIQNMSSGQMTLTGDLRLSSGANLTRMAHESGHLEGSYNNVGSNGGNSNPIYTIGSSYNPSSTALGNMYGIGFTSASSGFITGGLATGNWGMYVAADGDARVWLEASNGRVCSVGDMRSSAFYDIDDTAYFLNASSTGDSLVTRGTIHIGPSGHLGIGDISHPKIAYPGEGAAWAGSGTTTGQVVIDLPGSLDNYDMLYLEIDIYEYSAKNATKLIIGGHNWNSGGQSNTTTTQWHNVGCKVIGDMNKAVRFGWRDDSGTKRRCIAIGDTTSSWSYGTVHVAKCSGATDFYNNAIDYTGNWEVNQTTSTSFFTGLPNTNFNATSEKTLKTHGRMAAYGYTGNGNVGGTGEASWHPSGIYSNGTNWLYGQIVMNNNIISGCRRIEVGADNAESHILRRNNANNTEIRTHASGAAGLLVRNGSDQFRFQLYGDGSNYGFLDGIWASWDLQKTTNGALYMNGNTSYYLNPASSSLLNNVTIAGQLNMAAGNYEGSIVFGTVDSWHTGIRQHDDADAELRIWAANSNGRIHIATGYNGEPASIARPTDGFVVDHNNVGIGNFSAVDPSEKLHVLGNILASGNVTAYSDRKLKENIEPIENAVNKVQQLNGVTFNRNDLEDTSKRYAGLIAQDVEQVLPEAVRGEETLAVDYNATIGLLVEAIKELKSEVDDLKEQLKNK